MLLIILYQTLFTVPDRPTIELNYILFISCKRVSYSITFYNPVFE